MIIDASVAFKWLVEEEHSAEAIALLAEDRLFAPALIVSEVGNALWKQITRGELQDVDGAAEMLGRLPELLTLVEDRTLASRALTLAHAFDHPLYDCLYLALAEVRDEALVTADERLLRKTAGTQFAARVTRLA